ncbi:hypothetical protein Sste5346_001355 [Sporothrix stenoceras]|uniref:Uncharacterized protein n=1 Tax=Sporothrix stenoceras TaxID=5173 RepID=A0ABR3ZNV2_9PEZI
MDFYQEQHSYTLASNASVNSDDSDEDASWVMMSRDGEVVKLPGEKIYYKVIYVPARPTETFKSFSAPILDFEDTRVASSFFGPWSWNAIVKPTIGGGIPSDVPRLELKLTFKEGGHDAFQNKFEVMKERLSYARTLQQETGQVIPTGEDLPQYEPPKPSGPPATASSAATATTTVGEASRASDAKEREALDHFSQSHEQQTPRTAQADLLGATLQQNNSRNQPSPIMPDEPPPDYEEAQAQAIGNRFEENTREAADQQ